MTNKLAQQTKMISILAKWVINIFGLFLFALDFFYSLDPKKLTEFYEKQEVQILSTMPKLQSE
jgi:hypothetical protein